jgi:hypothetical protein
MAVRRCVACRGRLLTLGLGGVGGLVGGVHHGWMQRTGRARKGGSSVGRRSRGLPLPLEPVLKRKRV